MQRLGLQKDPTQTPYEFALQCQSALAASPEQADLAPLPVELVGEFYAVRFGGEPLDAERKRRVRRAMRELRRAAQVPPEPGIDDESMTGVPAVAARQGRSGHAEEKPSS